MTTIVFPGQGSQYHGMAKDFVDNFKISKTILEEIEDYTSLDLRKILFDDSDDRLNQTKFTQIAIFTASLIIYKTLENQTNTLNVNCMLGHSLGEYTALVCSNKISLEEGSKILIKRGNLMNTAVEPNKTGMAALIGISSVNLEKIIKNKNLNIEIANDNSPLQVVISGLKEDINECKDILEKNGVKKFVNLNVSAAFHSKYMSHAQEELSNEINNLNMVKNNIKIISNFTSKSSSDNEVIIDALKNQMSNRVKWTQSIMELEKLNQKKIIEIGPGQILSGLIRRISKNFDIVSINKLSDLNMLAN